MNQVQKALKSQLSIFLLLMFFGCSDYSEPTSYSSPNDEFILDVTTEFQYGNDPDPIWKHVSLRKTEDAYSKKGNVLIISMNNDPEISWASSDTVKINISGNVGQSFDLEEIK